MNLTARLATLILAGMATQATAAPTAIRCTEFTDAASGKRLVREGQCDQRVTPASTFKIAISLMGYDSRILIDEHAPTLPFRKGYLDCRHGARQPTPPAG